MTSAAPDLALNSILTEIATLVDATDVDHLKLARLERDLAKIWQASAITAADYHMTRALLSMAKRRTQPALDAAREALRWTSGNAIVENNCLTVMTTVMAIDDAIRLIRLIVARHPDDLDALKGAIIKASDVLQFSLAVELLEKFNKLTTNLDSVSDVRRKHILTCRDAMIRHKLTDEDLAARLKVAVDALRKKNFEAWRSSRLVLDDGCLIYYVHVDADPDRCAELNFDIADALVEEFEDTGADFVSIACRPLADLQSLNVLKGDPS